MSVNKVILLGNLGKDPELKYLDSGKAVCTFSVATSENWKDNDGNKQEKTTWHNIVAWGKVAEVISEYFNKGSQIYVEGKIANRSYEKDGVTKYVSEVVLSQFSFVGNKNDNQGGGNNAPDNNGADDHSDRPF